MERTTKSIQTQNGHTLVLRDYITGGEKREIQAIYVQAVAEEKKVAEVSAQADDKAFELVLVSLDGTNDNLVSRVLDLPQEDFEEVTSAVGEVVMPKKKLTQAL